MKASTTAARSARSSAYASAAATAPELLSYGVRDRRGDQFVAGVVRVHAVVVELGVYVAVRVIKIREVRIN